MKQIYYRPTSAKQILKILIVLFICISFPSELETDLSLDFR